MFCSIFRLMISHAADGDSRLSETTEKHLSHCLSCREFYEICLALGEGLTREAAISNEEVSEQLSARVPKIKSRPRIETYTMRLRLRPIMAAACVALIVLTGISFLALRRDGQDAALPVHKEPVAELRALAGENFPALWPRLINEPLANELNNLTNDTKSALRFLVARVAVDIPDTEGKSVN